MITSLEQVFPNRLTWPEGKPRASYRRKSQFTGREVAAEERLVEQEMARWGIKKFIVSRNHQRIYAGDPAVAVWWLDAKGQLRVLACDKWDKLADNMRAIHLTLDAMRALERWGAYTAEQAAEGAKLLALPSPDGVDWRKELDCHLPSANAQQQLVLCEASYRSMARYAGGDEARLRRLNAAIEAARRELRP